MSQQKPATDALLTSLRAAVSDVAGHDHPLGSDLYCLNLTSFMGERMGPVLQRLAETEAEVARLRAQIAEVRAMHTDSIVGPCPACFRSEDVSDTDDGLVGYPCPTLRALGVEQPEPFSLFPTLGGDPR